LLSTVGGWEVSIIFVRLIKKNLNKKNSKCKK
jgi:hypothetical protein